MLCFPNNQTDEGSRRRHVVRHKPNIAWESGDQHHRVQVARVIGHEHSAGLTGEVLEALDRQTTTGERQDRPGTPSNKAMCRGSLRCEGK
jgi:hypothetical protein